MPELPLLFNPHGGTLDLLIVLPMATAEELECGEWLTSEFNEFLADFISGFDPGVKWGITPVFPGPVDKPSKKDIDSQVPDLVDRIWEADPKVILALGSAPLQALWPKQLGKVQSISKAKAMDLVFGQGTPLVVSLDPKSHYWYLKTEGRAGSDLREEYIRAFTKVGQILSGDYRPLDFEYHCIDTPEAAQWLVQRANDLRVTRIGFDTEDTTWWPRPSEKLKPHEWEVELPEKLSLWHDDTELWYSCVGWRGPGGKYEVYSLHPHILSDPAFCAALFANRTVSAWNILYEIASLNRFSGFDLCDPRWGVTLYDGMIRYAVRDQSVTAIGLKAVCQQYVGAPAWDVPLLQALQEAREERKEATGVSVAAIDDVPDHVARKYNCADVFYMMVLEDQYLDANKDGGLHPECRAYDNLIASLGFFSRMEATGCYIDLEYLYDRIEEKEAEISRLEEVVATHWATKYATELARRDVFNAASPICFQALVAVTHGRVLPQRELTEEEQGLTAAQRAAVVKRIVQGSLIPPQWAPRTERSRQLQAGKDQILLYAEHPETSEEHREIWKVLWELKEHKDEVVKYYTILNYTTTSTSRIHASYRIVRSANEFGDNNSASGSVSGRTATNPNVQNAKPELKPCYSAPPGFTKVMIDIKGAEMVVIGYTTGDEKFREWALQGRDSHLEKGAILWGYAEKQPAEDFFRFRSREEASAEVPGPSEEQKPWRRLGKTLNFAALYMQEPFTFAQIVGITEEEAVENALRDREMFPGVYQAQCALYESLQRGDPAITKIFGRVRYATGWVKEDLTAEEFLSFDRETARRRHRDNMRTFRSIWNFLGAQADANDIGITVGKVVDYLLRHGYLDERYVRLERFIHDALVFDIWTPYVDTAVPYLAQVFENVNRYLQVNFDLPVRVSAEAGPNMGALETYEWRQHGEK